MSKALTIRQPWASAIVEGFKTIETRSRMTKFRGRILIHAGRKDFYAYQDNILMVEELKDIFPQYSDLETGAIIGSATLADCVPVETIDDQLRTMPIERALGDYSDGRFAWILTDVKKFKQPIRNVKGQLGLWTYPMEKEVVNG
jgi:activating signal cointegrator 1